VIAAHHQGGYAAAEIKGGRIREARLPIQSHIHCVDHADALAQFIKRQNGRSLGNVTERAEIIQNRQPPGAARCDRHGFHAADAQAVRPIRIEVEASGEVFIQAVPFPGHAVGFQIRHEGPGEVEIGLTAVGCCRFKALQTAFTGLRGGWHRDRQGHSQRKEGTHGTSSGLVHGLSSCATAGHRLFAPDPALSGTAGHRRTRFRAAPH